MDIFEELRQLFAQVAIYKWYPIVKDFTFRTESLELSKDEAMALLRKNKEITMGLDAVDEETNKTIDKLSTKLQDFLEKHFQTKEGVKAFIKLSDRSPKDATNLESKIEKLYNERVEQIPEVINNL